MSERGVPRLMPISTAAAVLGVARDTFRARYLHPGLVDAERDERGRICVTTASLEAVIGRELSASAYLVADAGREPARQYQRDYRREHEDAGDARPPA